MKPDRRGDAGWWCGFLREGESFSGDTEGRGAEDSGGVAEAIGDDGGHEDVGEDASSDLLDAAGVEFGNVGEAAADDDDVGVEDGEEVGEGGAELPEEEVDGAGRDGVALAVEAEDVGRVEGGS